MISSHTKTGLQQGMALVITLVFMLILTIIGIFGLQSGIVQSRMAGNQQDYDMAFQATEAALRRGERVLDEASSDTLSSVVDSAQNCRCTPNRVHDTNNDSLSAQPSYCIEEIRLTGYFSGQDGGSTIRRLYCVRAMGVGASDSAQVMLESRFIKAEEV